MKILHVNKFFDLHGGAEVYLQQLMTAQREQGHEVHVFSTKSEKNVPIPDAKYFVERFSLDQREGVVKDAKKAANYLWNQEAKKELTRMLDEVKPDIVHLHNIYHHLSTSILSPIQKRRLPCVQTLHDYKLACPNYRMFTEGAPCERCKGGKYFNAVKHHCLAEGFLPNVLAALEMGFTKTRQSYERTVRLFLCPSHFMKEKMQDWGEPASKLRYLPNPTSLAPTPAPRGGGYLLYVGRLSPEKGIEGFLRAAARIPEVSIKLAGRGPQEASLRALVKELSLTNVEFLGFRAPSELVQIRREAEAIILPTLSYENASGALLEALSDGIPCLATRIGGNPELVEEGKQGYLVKPGDVDDWERVIKRFFVTPSEERNRMGDAGRAKIQAGRTWEQHVDQMIGIYREIKGS